MQRTVLAVRDSRRLSRSTGRARRVGSASSAASGSPRSATANSSTTGAIGRARKPSTSSRRRSAAVRRRLRLLVRRSRRGSRSELGCATIDDVWACASRDGESWLAPDAAVLEHEVRASTASSGSARARTRCAAPDTDRSRCSSSSATVRSAPARSAACRSSRGSAPRASRSGRSTARRTALVDRDLSVAAAPSSSRSSTLRRSPTHARARRTRAPHVPCGPHREAVRARSRAATDPVTRLEGDVWVPRRYFALSASMSAGTTLCTSPTMPRSATEKIGASPSLLTAMMLSLFFMPTRCCVAPEMPSAM